MYHERLEPASASVLDETQPALRRSSECLFQKQLGEGSCCRVLTGDTRLESDYILLQLWLNQPEGAEWDPPTRDRIARAARSILERQLPDGGFPKADAQAT